MASLLGAGCAMEVRSHCVNTEPGHIALQEEVSSDQ